MIATFEGQTAVPNGQAARKYLHLRCAIQAANEADRQTTKSLTSLMVSPPFTTRSPTPSMSPFQLA